MTVATTSDGMVAGVVDGKLSLDYVRAGWLDFFRSKSFLNFCAKNRLTVDKVDWGRERVYRASLGKDIQGAADMVDRCFAEVFGHGGPFRIEFRPFGWTPTAQESPEVGEVASSNNSLERPR